jgi:hypothetical protein
VDLIGRKESLTEDRRRWDVLVCVFWASHWQHMHRHCCDHAHSLQLLFAVVVCPLFEALVPPAESFPPLLPAAVQRGRVCDGAHPVQSQGAEEGHRRRCEWYERDVLTVQ